MNETKRGFLQLHLSVLLAGFTGLFGKLITLNEVDIVWYRMLFTSAILLVFTGLPKVGWKKFLQLSGCGALLGLHWMLFYGSIKASNVSIGVVCFSLIGFFTAICEPIILRRKFSFIELLLSLITVAGVLCIFSFDARYRYGIMIGIVSSLVCALYVIYNKKASVGVRSRDVLMSQMSGGLIAVTAIIPVYLWFFPSSQPVVVIPEGSNVWFMLCHALFCTVGMYLLQIQALKRLSAFTVNLTYNLEPCYTIILAFLIFGEGREVNFSFYLGIALIVLSVLLQSLKAMNVIHLKRFFTVLILLTATQWAAAQEKAEEMPHVKSFVAEVSEQVEQGVPFTVTYTLSARSWQAGGKPLAGKGFRLLNVSYNTLREQPYMRMVATATYVTSLNGQVELPGMTIPVKGETVRTERKVINVTPNRRYGEEMRVAHEWLLNHGQHPDSICLSDVQEDEGFLLFEDIYNRCFCMVAQKSVWPLVGQPVLAYSTEDAIYMKNDRQHYNKMVQPYRSQISALKKSQGRSVVDEPLSYSPRSAAVGPLLGDVRWGQNQPYNIGSPTIEGKKALTGCVPLAVGMILNYHQWPKKGTSHAYYQSTDQKVYEIDYADFAPQWSQFKKSYPEQGYDASIYSLSQVFTILGLSIDAKFKGNATSASLGNIKPALCNNLGYSGRAMLHHKNLTDGQIASLIYRDLDRGLPCIVSSDGHAFVCDGYKDGFLHFNLGWYGNYNGYYRLKLGNYVQPEDGSNLLLVKYLMCNIEPQREEHHRDVVVEQAGTLSKLLSQDEKEQLTSLRLSGELNSSDIRLLRKMTGGSDDLTEYGSWQGGSLTRLDMKDATIVADEEPYLTIVATGGWSHSVTENDVTTTVSYDFGHMDEQQWQQFKTDIGEKQEGVIYSRSDDNRYWANYHCENDVVGNQMFLRCASLREIILPQSTKKIDSFAFFGCSLLQRIKVPEQTAQLGRKPFSNCSSLELIELPRNIQTEDEVSESCSPALNQKVY